MLSKDILYIIVILGIFYDSWLSQEEDLVIDTLLNEGVTHKVMDKWTGCSQSAVLIILMERLVEG